MKWYSKTIVASVLLIVQAWSCIAANDVRDTLLPVIAPGIQPVLVSRQFGFTEGPAPDKKGNIYFTDQPNNKIWKYDTRGKLSVFLETAGRSNGLYVDRKGHVVACADEKNELWSVSKGGKKTILLDNFDGKKLNGPNDLWITPGGGIYFTDPYYQRDYWTRQQPEIKQQRVYYLAAGRKEAVIATEELKKPNGIVGSPDGKLLYIADIGAGKIYQYSILPDGKLADGHIIINQGADGMTLDNRGNLYLCGKGVTVYSPTGEKIAQIPIPESWTANACFGGKDHNILFITASTAIYVVKMLVKGVE